MLYCLQCWRGCMRGWRERWGVARRPQQPQQLRQHPPLLHLHLPSLVGRYLLRSGRGEILHRVANHRVVVITGVCVCSTAQPQHSRSGSKQASTYQLRGTHHTHTPSPSPPLHSPLQPGETGCGKSSRVPLYLLDAMASHTTGHGGGARIMVAQPRRLAAHALHRRAVDSGRGSLLD